MPNELPDRLSVTLQVMQRFKDLGQPYTDEDVLSATNDVLRQYREQHFSNMPRGMQMYEYEGSESSAGFLKRMIHNAKNQFQYNLVAGSIGTALSLSDSEWAIRASEDMRKWANDAIAEQVAKDTELQAYYAWKEDEPSWSGFDTTLRAASEVIPSLAASVAGTALGVAMAPATGGSSLVATVAGLTPMFLLESSSHYIQQMDLMVDEMGLSPEEANEYAGLAAVTYGTVSSILERTGARALMKGTPGLKQLVPEKALMRGIAESLVESGAKKSTLGRLGMNQLARLTGVVEKAMIEGGTEWSQSIAEAISMYATEHDFKDVNDFLRTIKESITTESSLEQAFGGAIMGIPFGYFGLPSGSVTTDKQVDKTIKRAKDKLNAGGFDVVEDEDIDATSTLNNFLSAIVNPGDRGENLGSFLENFKVSDDKTSKAIDSVKDDTDLSAALLSLIKKDPTVIASIENHENSESLLRLASQKLNKQKPQERQIDVENSDEMLNAIKQFAIKGDIKQSESPADYNESKSEPEIEYNPDWLDQDPTEKELSMIYGQPDIDKEPDIGQPIDEEPSAQEIQALQERVSGITQQKKPKVTKPKVETQQERQVNVGKTGVVSGVKTGRAKTLEGKQVAILAATPKMYKVQELDEDGKGTGPQMYVFPNQIGIGEGERQIGVEGEQVPTPAVTPETPKETDVITAEDLLGKEEDVIAKEDLVDKEEVGEEEDAKLLEIKNKIVALRKEDGSISKENLPELKKLQKEKLQREKLLATDTTGNWISIQNIRSNVMPLIDKQVEKKITDGIRKKKDPKVVLNQVAEIMGDMFVSSTDINKLLLYIENRINDGETIGNNKESFGVWRQGKTSQADIKAEDLVQQEVVDEDITDLDEGLPEGVPDVNQPVEDLTELENKIDENQLRAEQRKKDYVIDGESYDRVSNVIGTTYTGPSFPDATNAGNTIDSLVRSFFNEGETPVYDDKLISKEGFDSLMKALSEVKKQIDEKGLRVMSNNIITWDDSSGVAGEIDLLVLNPKTGKIQIWDIKTSKARTTSKSYDKKWKGNDLVRSKREQQSIQLSAYKRLIENQYGIEVEKIAIFPFYINYTKSGRVTFLEKEKGITLEFDKSFTDTIIPPNKTSSNISSLAQEPEIETTEEKPVLDPEEPSDSEIENMRNTLFASMNQVQSDEEKGDDSDQDIEIDMDEDQQFFQEKDVSPLTKITAAPDLAQKIVNRLRKHFGNYITDETFEGVLNKNGRKIVGTALNNVAMWSRTDATLDTMPHEYAHIYVGLMRDTDLIKRGIKYFGSEERLVQHIGEYYANRIQNKSVLQRIKIWLKQFANRLRNIFGSIPEDTIGNFLAEEFYQGRFPEQIAGEYDPFIKYQEQSPTNEDGIDKGVPTHRTSSKDIPSDIHQKEFFHRVFGVHIDKAQVPALMEIAKDSKSFDDYIDNIKNWAKEQAKEKSYRIAIKTEYNESDLNELKIMYLKDRQKIYRYVPNDKTGLFTRIYYLLQMPVGRGTKNIFPSLGIAPLQRLDTEAKESQSHTTNFFEEDLNKGHHTKKLIYLPMRNIINRWYDKENNKDVYWQANTRLTQKVLNRIKKANISKYIGQVVKYGEEQANMLFLLGTKGGDNDAILFGRADNEHIGMTKDQFEQYLNTEVAEKRMKPEQVEVILEEYTQMDFETASQFAINTVNRKDISKLIKPREGETLRDAQIRIAKRIIPIIQSLQFAEVVSTHEYMKSIKYNKYAMDEKHILDTYTRLSIDLSEGYSPKTDNNSLDSKIMIVPKNTQLMRRNKKTGVLDYAGTFDETDGETMSGSDWLYRLGDNIGTPRLAAIKTSIRHRSKDGNDYLGMKHLQMTPFSNLEFYEEGSNVPFARVVTNQEGKTYFEKLDKNGKVVGKFDHMASPNEAKQRAGKFNTDYELHDIKESDVKVILNPSESSDTAAHPIALGEILLDPSVLVNKDTPEAMELVKQIIKHYADYDSKGNLQGGVAKEYLDMLKSMRRNPRTFLDAVRRTLQEGKIPTEAEKWLEILEKTKGKGIHHKYLTNLFVSYLNNIYFSNGIFKSRKMGRGNATHGYLKPTAGLKIPEKSVAVSSENTTVYNRAIKHWASLNENLRTGEEKLTDFQLFNRFTRRKTANEKVDILNEALAEKELNVLIHRQPIAKVTGVVTRRVAYLVAGNHGDTIFLRHSDVNEVLDGDYDGDHGFMEFIEGDLLKAYQDWQNSDTFAEKDKVVAIPMFGEKLEDTDSNVSYLSKQAKNTSVVDQASVSGSQGRTTNAKTVMTQLAYKNLKLYVPSLKGGFLSSKKPSDSVTIDYINLDINQLNKENGKLLKIISNNNDSIVNENGDVIEIREADDGSMSIKSKEDIFLKTTVEHELAILLQMSVDNKKFGLLSKVGWKNDFILRRIFQRSDGEELTESNIHSLRILFRVQNFSSQRAGKTESRNVASMNRVVEDSSTLAERFFDKETGKRISKEETGEKYIKEMRSTIKKQRFYKGEFPDNITTNGSITPGEILISSVGREYNKIAQQIENPEQAGSHFLDWSETAYQVSHQRTINELGQDEMFNEDNWNEKDLIEAYDYLIESKYDKLDLEGNPTGKKISLNNKFWQIYNDAARKTTGETPIHISADYNAELTQFIDEHIDEWSSLSENAQDIVTAFFLKGVGKRTNILTLMPLDLMSSRVMEKFVPVFDKNLRSLTDKDFSEQTGKAKEKPGYKNLNNLVVKSKNLFEKKSEELRVNCS